VTRLVDLLLLAGALQNPAAPPLLPETVGVERVLRP
jgi:hypothetical protein